VRLTRDTGGEPTSLTLAELRKGNFVARVRGQNGSTGSYELDVYLAGDTNADFHVDQQDISRIRSLRGVRSTDASYELDADVDRNGVINRADLQWAQQNVGVSTAIRPLFVTVGLDASFDQDGDGVIHRWDPIVMGHTNPTATVRLDHEADGTYEQSTRPDATGDYQLTIPANVGDNPIRAEASDSFGQLASASLIVRRSANTAISTDPGVQQMPLIAVNPLDPDHIVMAFMDQSLVDSGYTGIATATSRDGGSTWQPSSIPLPAGFDEGAANPWVKFDDGGHVYVAFMSVTFLGPKPPITNANFFNPERGASDRDRGMTANNGIFVSRSDDAGLTWNQAVSVASHLYDGQNQVPFEVIPDLAIDTFRLLPDGRPNPNYGNLYVGWTRLYPPGQFPGHPEFSGGGDMMLAVSSDLGEHWEIRLQEQPGTGVQVSVIQDPPTASGQGVPPGLTPVDQAHLAIGPEGDIYYANAGGGDFVVQHSTDGGVSFTVPNHDTGLGLAFGTGFSSFAAADGIPTNRFRTHMSRSIAADPMRAGHVYAVEHIRVLDPAGKTLDPADVFFARSTDHGQTWDSVFRIGNDPASVLNDDNGGQVATGGPDEVVVSQALPRLVVDGRGNVGVIWLDARRDPAGHLLDVFGTVSTDGGLTFSPNFRVTTVSFDADRGRFTDATGHDNFYLGDFLGLAMAHNSSNASWTDTRNGNQDVFFARYQLDPAPAPTNDRFEPNETPGTATALGRIIQQVLPRLAVPTGDKDWFRVQTAATGDLIGSALFTSDVNGSPSPLRLELWNGTGTALLVTGNDLVDGSGNLVGQEFQFPASAGEFFLVRASASQAPGASTETVLYSLRFQSLTDNLGTRAFARVAQVLAPGGGALYLVRAAASGSIDAKLTAAEDATGILDLDILDPVSFAVLAHGQPGPQLTATSVEPNDSIGQANATGLVGPGSVTVDSTVGDGDFGSTSGDFDFFAIEAGARQRISVDLSAKVLNSSLDGVIFLYDSAGNLLASQDSAGGGGNETVSFVTSASDTYFVVVLGCCGPFPDPFVPGSGGGVASTGAFRITITIDAIGPGSIRNAAMPVQKGQPLLLLVSADSASSGSFSLDFTNLDQFATPDNSSLLFPAGPGPSQSALGDLNRDGKQDIVVSNALLDTVSVILGNGDGTFQSPRQFGVGAFVAPNGVVAGRRLGTFRRQVVIEDFSGDGVPDVAVTNYDSSDVSVLLGRGDGTFEPQRRFDATPAPWDVDLGDFNGDGTRDLVVVASRTVTAIDAAVLLGRGNGTFQPQKTFQLQLPSSDNLPFSAVGVGDLNKDGRDDLVLSGTTQSRITTFLGNGDGTFTSGADFDAARLGAGLVVADINGDTHLDVMNTGMDHLNQISVALGNGDGTFRPRQDFFAGQNPIAVQVVDFGSQVTMPDGSLALGARDGRPDLIVAVSGLVFAFQSAGGPKVVILPGIFEPDAAGNFVLFGTPQQLSTAEAPIDVDTGDVNRDGAVDIIVVDRPGIRVIFGQPPNIVPNNTLATARDLGTVVHVVEQTRTIVPGHEDAFFKLKVPTEAAAGAGDEVIDFSALFEATEGPGLAMEVLDAAGNVLGSGERFRVRAPQGAELTLHVFGVEAADGTRGAGAYTLAINVLPQVVSVESQPLLPGVGANPGGPTTSLVVTLQGDRLDPATAEKSANYRITWLGPDGTAGTPDDEVKPIVCGVATSQCVVYDPSVNLQVASGKTYPTAVRQTVTFTFAQPLPAGSYEVELLPAIQTAPFNEDEAGLLAGNGGFTGHPVVSVVGGTVVEGSRKTAVDLVLASGALGDLSVFKTGTPFLTQLHADLAALLDSQLTELGDDDSVTPAIMDQILRRFDSALNPIGSRTTPVVVIWLDPGGIDVEDPFGDDIVWDPVDDELRNDTGCTYVDVTGNIVVMVIPECGAAGGGGGGAGTYLVNVSNIAPTARGGALFLGRTENKLVSLTDALRSGTTSFALQF
jgi:hypothetical protein